LLEFNGKRPLRKNLTVEPIVLSDEQNQQLDKIMRSKKGKGLFDVKSNTSANKGQFQSLSAMAGMAS